MTSDHSVKNGWQALATLLTHQARPEQNAAGTSVNVPLTRGSTVLFPTLEDMNARGKLRYEHEYIYGAMGSPPQHELEKILATIEGGTHCQAVSSGLAACTMPFLTFLKTGDHCLLPDNVYGPTRRFANHTLKRFGVETTFYPPSLSPEKLQAYFRDNTRMLFTESPGSHTFEVQDIPALAALAHKNNALLTLDNTWGFGIFKPFEHGVDISVQALTKYPSGHSDVIAGAIIVNTPEHWKILRDTAIELGQLAGADDCWLTLRGLRTMGVRLAHQSQSALAIAQWLTTRPEVKKVLHPALPDCPGHEFWKRDFKGAGSLFGVILKADYAQSAMERFINNLQLFGIGASWGGYESLVLPTSGGMITRNYEAPTDGAGPSFRLQIGLENIEDLKADLSQAFVLLKS